MAPWDGTVDTTRRTTRGWRRIAYDDLPTVCAGMILCCAPRRFVGPKFWVKPASRVTAFDLRYEIGWEDGVPLLRENYVTIAIDSNGYGHVVWASAGAWSAGVEALRDLRRIERTNRRVE